MKEKTIVLCEVCKGEGTVTHERLTNYHRGEYEYWKENCPICKGFGRRYKVVITEFETMKE